MLIIKRIVAMLPMFACLMAAGQDKDFSFIKRSSVTWAADVSAAYQLNNPNISLALRQKLAAGKLIAFIPGENEEEQEATAADVRQRIAPNRTKDVVDDNGNVVATTMEADDPLFSARYFSDQTNSSVLLKQLLYIRDGLLKIYIPSASPKYSVFTSWGEELGQAPAFSTAANKCLKIPRSRSRMIMFDTATSIVINLDTMQAGAMVKQLYGHNLLQALWPDFKKQHYQFFVGNSKTPVTFAALNMDIINGDAAIKVPVYDSIGNISGYTAAPSIPLDLSLFTKVEIMRRNWFNAKKNRFFSEPYQLVFYARRWLNAGWEAQPSPVLMVKINKR